MKLSFIKINYDSKIYKLTFVLSLNLKLVIQEKIFKSLTLFLVIIVYEHINKSKP